MVQLELVVLWLPAQTGALPQVGQALYLASDLLLQRDAETTGGSRPSSPSRRTAFATAASSGRSLITEHRVQHVAHGGMALQAVKGERLVVQRVAVGIGEMNLQALVEEIRHWPGRKRCSWISESAVSGTHGSSPAAGTGVPTTRWACCHSWA